MAKKYLLTMIAVVAVTLFSLKVYADIATSKHNLASSGPNDSGIESTNTDDICVFCHTPHADSSSTLLAPLWNHADTTQTFTAYSSATIDATMGQPTGVSKACMSCHDGVTAVNNLLNNVGSGAGTDPTMQNVGASGEIPAGVTALGTDMNYIHPVSFTYDAALATTDGELYDPTTQGAGIAACTAGGGHIDDCMLFGASNDQLECASCHDVHDDTISMHLIKSNAASALCMTCHDK